MSSTANNEARVATNTQTRIGGGPPTSRGGDEPTAEPVWSVCRGVKGRTRARVDRLAIVLLTAASLVLVNVGPAVTTSHAMTSHEGQDKSTRRLPRLPRWVKYTALGVGAVTVAVVGWRSFTMIQAGHQAVLTRFGKTNMGTVLTEGFNLKNPLDKARKYDLRIATSEAEPTQVQAANGENNVYDLVIKSAPAGGAPALPTYHQKLGAANGPTYLTSTVRAALRQESSQRTSEQLHMERLKVAADTKKLADNTLTAEGFGGIFNYSVELRKFDPPQSVKNALEGRRNAEIDKETAEHELAATETRAQKVEKEANSKAEAIKTIANAQAKANSKIEPTLTDKVLMNNYIEAIKQGADLIVLPSAGPQALLQIPTGTQGK